MDSVGLVRSALMWWKRCILGFLALFYSVVRTRYYPEVGCKSNGNEFDGILKPFDVSSDDYDIGSFGSKLLTCASTCASRTASDEDCLANESVEDQLR